jgi:hypothetical protein
MGVFKYPMRIKHSERGRKPAGVPYVWGMIFIPPH